MIDHAEPSRDPANDESLLGMARVVLDKFLQQIDDMLPARVVSYDRTANRATVVPLVKMLTTDGRQIGRAQVASVPVMMFGGSGVAMSFDLVAGDLGWIKANDRDISLILQGYKDEGPNTLRKHSFQDAVFIPEVMHGLTLASEDAHHAVLQTLDGTVKVAIWPDRVKIAAGSFMAIIGPSSIDFHGRAIFHDPVEMMQTLDVTGATALSSTLEVTGLTTATAGVLTSTINSPGGAGVGIDGLPIGTHKHTGVQTGTGTSGGPTA